MALPFPNKFQGWNLTTPNSGDDFDDEFDQLYANDNFLEENGGGSSVTRTESDISGGNPILKGQAVSIVGGRSFPDSGNQVKGITTGSFNIGDNSSSVTADSVSLQPGVVIFAMSFGIRAVQANRVTRVLSLVGAADYGNPSFPSTLINLKAIPEDGGGASNRVLITFTNATGTFCRVALWTGAGFTLGNTVTVTTVVTPKVKSAVNPTAGTGGNPTTSVVCYYNAGNDVFGRAVLIDGVTLTLGPAGTQGTNNGDFFDVAAFALLYVRNNLEVHLRAFSISIAGVINWQTDRIIEDLSNTIGAAPGASDVSIVASGSSYYCNYFGWVLQKVDLITSTGFVVSPLKWLKDGTAVAISKRVSNNQIVAMDEATGSSVKVNLLTINKDGSVQTTAPFLTAVANPSGISASPAYSDTLLIGAFGAIAGQYFVGYYGVTKYLGIAQDDILDSVPGTNEASVVTSGVSSAHTGLTEGEDYYADAAGILTPDDSINSLKKKVGKAISDTEILLVQGTLDES